MPDPTAVPGGFVHEFVAKHTAVGADEKSGPGAVAVGPDPPGSIVLISDVVSLLFDAGLALNSIQQTSMSTHDTGRASDAVQYLDRAVRDLRALAVSLMPVS